MLDDHSSRDIRIAEVAQRACVSVQSIYYYFESLSQLIAQAQVSKYIRIVEPLHEFLETAEVAAINGDEPDFWKAISDDLMLAWSNGQGAAGWRISKLLIDIWSDEKTQREFSKQVGAQFHRWIAVVELAKKRGWIDIEIDSEALIAVCWASTNGQSIFAFSSLIKCSPESARDFLLQTIRPTRGVAAK
jgi:AcrR family transcriptional regulator